MNKIDHYYFKIRNQMIKAICTFIGGLINRLRQWKAGERLFALAIVKIAKPIQLSYLRTIEEARPQKEEDARHIAKLRSTLEQLEKLKRGEVTLKELEDIYDKQEDSDEDLAAEVRMNRRLEELGAFKKNLIWHILGY